MPRDTHTRKHAQPAGHRETQPPLPPARLADRLSAAQRSLFVGREEEQTLFRTAIGRDELPFSVLFIFGPGGVGKTSLVHALSGMCEAHGREAIRLDGRDMEPAPEAFLRALSLALRSLGYEESASPLEVLAASRKRRVLFIDTYELLAPLDDWLRDEFLPQLPADVLVVLAGRQAPGRGWRIHSGWQQLMRTVSLRNLAPEESRAYLRNRAIPAAQHAAVLDFTHGHPLALSLVADLFDQSALAPQRATPGASGDRRSVEFRFDPAAAPDVVQLLLEHLVQHVPSPAHRAALEMCALVRLTTEEVLAQVLFQAGAEPAVMASAATALPAALNGEDEPSNPDTQAHAVFEWLRTLSFIELGRDGVFPHDVIREALLSDLRWRNPGRYGELHRRAHNFYSARYAAALQQTSAEAPPQEAGRILFDYIFLHSSNPTVRPFLEWQDTGGLTCGGTHAADWPALRDMVARHEGEVSARLAAHWFTHQPRGFITLRDAGGVAGFVARVDLHAAAPGDRESDPGTHAAWRYLEENAPLREGEGAAIFRFWMARDTYQDVSPAQSLIFITIVRHFLSTPALAFTLLTCADPDFWAPALALAETQRLPADFDVGGRRYGMYGHDWRAMPPPHWMAALAEREVAAAPEASAAPETTASPLALSRPEFTAAVQHALRNITRPAVLRRNVLLRSHLVAERAGPHATPDEQVVTLQTLLKEACETLQDPPRDAKFYRALYHAYLHPAPSREAASVLLDIPFGTFRRHLQAGLAHVQDLLWQREVGG